MKKKKFKVFKKLLFILCVVVIIYCYRAGITNADILNALNFSKIKDSFSSEIQPHLDIAKTLFEEFIKSLIDR